MQNEVSASHIAGLAMLELTQAQAETVEKDLAGMIAFTDRLCKLNTDGIPATAHIAELQNVMREDDAITPFDRDCMLANAPASQAGFVTVPVQGQV